MNKRLSAWNKNFISLGDRIALIRSTLSNLPTYYLSIFKATNKVVKIIEKLQGDFLWEPRDPIKDHLLKWEIVYKPGKLRGRGRAWPRKFMDLE